MTERGPVDDGALRSLLHAGLLPRDAVEIACAKLGAKRDWRRFADLLLLILGSGLIVSGVIFFVAYNWMAMDKFVKLGGLQVLVVGCAAAAWWRGLSTIPGRVLLFVACVLVGVFLAAFGQIYQTGADAWELFRAWAILIALFVAVSRDPLHWLLLLAVIDVSIASYMEVVGFARLDEVSWVWPWLAATQAVWILGCESARPGGYFRSSPVWTRWVLVPAILICLSMPATIIILNDRYESTVAVVTLAGLGWALAVGYLYFRHRAKDLFCLTCLGFCAAWLVTVLAFRALDIGHRGNCGAIFFIGLLVVAELTILVRWIRRVGDAIRQDLARSESNG